MLKGMIVGYVIGLCNESVGEVSIGKGTTYQGYEFQASRDLFDFDRILHDYPIRPGHR